MKQHRGRYTAASYRQIGVQDCIAQSAKDYVELALRIAADREFREDLRSRILEKVDLLFEDERAVEELAEFFRRAVEAS